MKNLGRNLLVACSQFEYVTGANCTLAEVNMSMENGRHFWITLNASQTSFCLHAASSRSKALNGKIYLDSFIPRLQILVKL